MPAEKAKNLGNFKFSNTYVSFSPHDYLDEHDEYEYWGLKFVIKNKNMGFRLSKTYFYKVPKVIIENNLVALSIKNDFFLSTDKVKTFKIVNEKKYNYRDSSVILFNIEDRKGAEIYTDNFITIIDINDSEETLEWKNCEDPAITNLRKYYQNQYIDKLTHIKSSINSLSTKTFPIQDCTIKIENSEKIDYNNITIKNKGENDMNLNSVLKNFKFGKAENVCMSIYGPAFKTFDDRYYSYDSENLEYVDVTGLIFSDNAFCYMMPVPETDIVVGDFIQHLDAWVRVCNFDDDGNAIVEKINTREIVTILPTRSAFNFNFYTKLIVPFDNLSSTASEKSPFGNFLPFLLLDDNFSSDKNSILPFILMNNMSNTDTNNIFSNPMFMYMMMKDNSDKNDFLLPVLMMNYKK